MTNSLLRRLQNEHESSAALANSVNSVKPKVHFLNGTQIKPTLPALPGNSPSRATLTTTTTKSNGRVRTPSLEPSASDRIVVTSSTQNTRRDSAMMRKSQLAAVAAAMAMEENVGGGEKPPDSTREATPLRSPQVIF